MKIRYYVETDTLLYIEFRHRGVVESRDLDENTLLDVGADGTICALAVEHASERTGIPEFSYEQAARLSGVRPHPFITPETGSLRVRNRTSGRGSGPR